MTNSPQVLHSLPSQNNPSMSATHEITSHQVTSQCATPHTIAEHVTTQAEAHSDIEPITYTVKTFGCQMNVHDSERISGLLEDMGYVKTADDRPADIIVFNTCAIRENAATKLYGTLSHLAPLKKKNPHMQIAVGGCLAQKDRETIRDKAPYVDVIFGTHNIGSLPQLLRRAQHNRTAEIEIVDTLQTFPSNLPARRNSAHSAWVSVSVGCNNTCTFCIVPSLRGKEIDRAPQEILEEIHMLVDQGVTEITLLGQNVNAYGINFADPQLPRNRSAFAELLQSCSTILELKRLRFTSPHPAEFTDDVLEAMAQSPNVCPSLHMPLQSGSNTVLRRMRRSYRIEKFFNIIATARNLIPHIAITTDIIVGFPGETDQEFGQTLNAIKECRFASAFTFQYSPRPGTPAATMPDQVPPEVVTQRYQQLVQLQDQISWEENQKLIGSTVEVLVGEDAPKKSHTRLSGRANDGRLVHFTPGDQQILPGDYVTVAVTQAAPHFLISDSAIVSSYRPTHTVTTEPMKPPQMKTPVLLGTPTTTIPVFSSQNQGCCS